MQDSELAFYTSQELISELMRRSTFCGVVVHSADEQKCSEWSNERVFKVHFNHNLDSATANRLLSKVANSIDIE